MDEGSRPAKPAIRSTGAEGSRHTERYARTVELVSELAGKQESVGVQEVLTPYVFPTVSVER